MAENDNFDWLTYETVFQQKRFARTNEKLSIGLYAIKRDEVTVFFRFGLADELLTQLTEAFFPDAADAKIHRNESDMNWEWKQRAAAAASAPVSPVAVALPISPAVGALYLNQWVVLPYNHFDNDSRSDALGTSESPILKQLKSDKKWEFWKTASRSCVMRLSRVKDAKADWGTVTKAWATWNFDEGKNQRANFVLPTGPPANGFEVAKKTSADFSVKTGVIWVGSEDQKTRGSKDNLDSNWIIACLRSDYVAAVDQEMGVDPHSDPELVVLTELLSINEKTARNAGRLDGVQVRDLSLLKNDCIYIPPLSIPVIDKDFKTRSSEFVNLTDPEWCDLWRRAWAASLGRGKALFLLRYGLQHLNPNVQNYLIEFKGDPPKPTGRIVIRDLQDASLQREVIWALHGPDEAPPAAIGELRKLKLPVLSYEFSPGVIDDCQETGTTNPQFGPPGMQFLWNRFSMFGGNNKDEEFVTRMLNEGNVPTFQNIAAADFAEFLVARSPITHWPESEFAKYEDYSELADDEERTKVRNYAINKDNPDALRRLYPNPILLRKYKSIVDAINDKAAKKVSTKQSAIVSKARKLLLALGAAWGKTHNLEYVHTCEKLLGVNFGIDWTKMPDPARHLLDPEISSKKELEWEEKTASFIQSYIASPQGQAKVREYKTRKWKAAAPKFRVRILNEDSKPIEEEPIRIIHNSRTWTDLTDRQGYVCIYAGGPEEYQFVIPRMTELAGSSFNMKELSQKNLFDFDYIKIEFVAG